MIFVFLKTVSCNSREHLKKYKKFVMENYDSFYKEPYKRFIIFNKKYFIDNYESFIRLLIKRIIIVNKKNKQK